MLDFKFLREEGNTEWSSSEKERHTTEQKTQNNYKKTTITTNKNKNYLLKNKLGISESENEGFHQTSHNRCRCSNA